VPRPAERAQLILNRLELEGDASIVELADQLGVSEMTVRRDLDRLEQSGAIRRAHGRAVKGASGSYEPPFGVRSERQVAEKQLIAREVASLLADRETVVLDGGSTGVAIARELVTRELTVCTPSLRVADVLRGAPDIRLMLTGGIMRRGEESLVGPSAVATLQEHRFDTYIMTVSGLDARQGCMEWNLDDAIIKRVALQVSTRQIVAADSTKFGATAFARICGLDAVSMVVSDHALSDSNRERIALAGPTVIIAA
jgi:DeoR/GlpR family transcriptional regulator of sugar metabolism